MTAAELTGFIPIPTAVKYLLAIPWRQFILLRDAVTAKKQDKDT